MKSADPALSLTFLIESGTQSAAMNPINQVLQGEDEGVVVEFVNPKYKAGSRTEFKKPTRLECMMQDFPKLMSKEMGDSAKVCTFFCLFKRWREAPSGQHRAIK